MTGPFQTEDQAIADPTVQAIYEAMRRDSDYRMQDGSIRMLLDACQQAGVDLGAYEGRIIRWIARVAEPQAAAAIAAVITRAGKGGTP